MARKQTSATQRKSPAKRAPVVNRSVIAGGFSQLINRAIRSGRLRTAGPAAQRLYSYLTYFAEPSDGFRFQVGIATLARLTGMARPTVRSGIEALGKNGLLATDQPATEGPDGQGIPAVYRLLVPDDAAPSDPALTYSAPIGVVSERPPSRLATDQSPDKSATGRLGGGAPSRRRATDHKQQRRQFNKQQERSEELAESVVLLQGEGVEDAAALEFAHVDPLHIRAVILTAHEKPNVRDTTAYIVKFLRMGWKPSPKLVSRARAERDAPARRAKADEIKRGRLAEMAAQEEQVTAERVRVDEALSGLTVDELDLLFDELLREAGELSKIYRRTGKEHPGTRAAMARLLTTGG